MRFTSWWCLDSLGRFIFMVLVSVASLGLLESAQPATDTP